MQALCAVVVNSRRGAGEAVAAADVDVGCGCGCACWGSQARAPVPLALALTFAVGSSTPKTPMQPRILPAKKVPQRYFLLSALLTLHTLLCARPSHSQTWAQPNQPPRAKAPRANPAAAPENPQNPNPNPNPPAARPKAYRSANKNHCHWPNRAVRKRQNP